MIFSFRNYTVVNNIIKLSNSRDERWEDHLHPAGQTSLWLRNSTVKVFSSFTFICRTLCKVLMSKAMILDIKHVVITFSCRFLSDCWTEIGSWRASSEITLLKKLCSFCYIVHIQRFILLYFCRYFSIFYSILFYYYFMATNPDTWVTVFCSVMSIDWMTIKRSLSLTLFYVPCYSLYHILH